MTVLYRKYIWKHWIFVNKYIKLRNFCNQKVFFTVVVAINIWLWEALEKLHTCICSFLKKSYFASLLLVENLKSVHINDPLLYTNTNELFCCKLLICAHSSVVLCTIYVRKPSHIYVPSWLYMYEFSGKKLNANQHIT